MQKRVLSALILIAYIAILIKVMVFKDIPTITIGHLMLNFGGTDAGHAPNFVPFTTIVPYLLGYKGLIIAGINLVGNIALLVPLGFLIPFVYRMTWKKSLALGVVSGLAIEVLQTVLHVGIFDIDDVILNALGVMVGYWMITILTAWIRERNYKNILIAALVSIAATAAFYGAVVYPITHQPVSPEGGDLCGGTGGIGQIVRVGNNSFTITQNDGASRVITLTAQATIKDSTGSVSVSDLKIGDRVTLVGDGNPDGSFTANTVLVCTALSS